MLIYYTNKPFESLSIKGKPYQNPLHSLKNLSIHTDTHTEGLCFILCSNYVIKIL